jgi:hypothetical protein
MSSKSRLGPNPVRFLKGAGLLGLLMSACTLAATPDPESILTGAQAARAWRDSLVNQPSLTPGEKESRREGLRRHFPGSEAAAEADADRVADLFSAGEWDACLAAATNFTANYPAFGGLQARVLQHLAQIAGDSKRIPEPTRLAACEALYPRARHSTRLLLLTRNALSGFDLPAAEKYALARLGATACGPYPSARAFWWTFLELYSRSAARGDLEKECESFLAAYPEESAESVSARTLLLRLRTEAGDAAAARDLRARTEKSVQDQAAARAIAQRMDQAVLEQRWEDALQTAGEFRSLPRYASESPAWTRLLTALGKQANPALHLRAFRQAFDCLPAGQTEGEAFSLLFRSSGAMQPEALALAAGAIKNNAQDRILASTHMRLLISRMRQADPPRPVQVGIYRDLIETARRLEMPEQEADYQRQLGELLWDLDPASATSALARAAEACPNSLAAAEAVWLNAFLTGANPLLPGPLPRAPQFLTDAAEAPAPALPPAPAAAQDVVASNGVFRLRALDPRVNLALNQAAAVSEGADSAAALTDGRADTAWRTERFPAAAVVPLREVSSVARVVVRLAEPCQLLVTLLGPDGRPLQRCERAWTFWEHSQTPALWASGDVAFELQPVAGVAYLRVEIPDSAGGDAGLREVEVYAPPFPAEGSHMLAPASLPQGAAQLAVRWNADEPERSITWDARTESARGFPIARWATPWKRPARRVILRQLGDQFGMEFYGTQPILLLEKQGGLRWTLDGAQTGMIQRTEDSAAEIPLAPSLAEGRHLLILDPMALPAGPDTNGADMLEFAGLKTRGRSRAAVRIRFRKGDAAWSDWSPLDHPEGSVVVVPPKVADTREASCQIGFFFDTRAVQAQATAAISNLVVEPVADPAAATSLPSDPKSEIRDSKFFPESLDAVARLVAARGVVVAYPKTGSVREYESARRLAERAGVYLVSDDIGLNLYPGLVLAVGRPAVHRYARQLLAMGMIWNDPDYLNNANGVVGLVRDADGNPVTCFATGETVEAVEAAARRLLDRLPAYHPASEPFRLFASDILEMVYAWQLQPARAAPAALELRLGLNDRRSVQFGVAAERPVDGVVRCSELRGPNGATLPAPRVRPVGFYEWIPFFGDLRLPNLLLDDTRLTLPPNTAQGVWVTVVTPEEATPGRYEGTVTVSSGSHVQTLPLRVTVEPVTLPDAGPVAFYSFAGVPYWFHEDTAAGSNALRALARNEAEQGVTHVQPRFSVDFACASPGATNAPAFTVDFSALDRQLVLFEKEYARAGRPLPAFLCQPPDLRPVARDTLPEEVQAPRRTARRFAEQFAAHLKQTDRAGRFIVKVGDEPGDIGKWAETARPYREGGLRTMTCHNTSYTNIEVAVGLMDPWCPNYQHDIFRPFFRERQKAGDAFWWYCCGVPGTRLTGSPIENLPFYWLTAKWKLDGAMNYAAMHASPASSMPVPFRYEHGMDHRIVFRPDGALLETTRRELEGDGIRDCRLIGVIREHIDRARKSGRTTAAADFENRLRDTLAAVVPYKYGYAREPAAWHAARNALYTLAIETQLPPRQKE